MLIGIAAGVTVLGATENPATSVGPGPFDLQPSDLLLTIGGAQVQHFRAPPPGLTETRDDGAPNTTASPSPHPSVQNGICLDSNNNAYVANTDDPTDTVSKLDPTSFSPTYPWATFAQPPTTCSVDSLGHIFVSTTGGAGGTNLYKLDPAGALQGSWALPTPASIFNPVWAAIDPTSIAPGGSGSDCVVYYTVGDNVIRRFDTCANSGAGAALTNLVTVPDMPSGSLFIPRTCYGVSVTPVGHVLVACGDAGFKYTETGAFAAQYDNTPGASDAFHDVKVDTNDFTVWFVAYAAGALSGHVHNFDFSGSPIKSFKTPANWGIASLAIVPPSSSPPTTTTPPTVTLSATPNTGIRPLNVTLDLVASPTPDSWILTFGDGTSTSGTGAVPSSIAHTYAKGGSYAATLTASYSGTDFGASALITVDTLPPEVALAASPASGPRPLSVNLTPVAKPDSESSTPITISSWTLDYGDLSPIVSGTGTPPASVPHTYDNAGTYTAKFSATDSTGKSGAASQSITADPLAPVVTLTPQPKEGVVPLKVDFFGTAQVDPSTTVASWTLDYDDPTATTPTDTRAQGAANGDATIDDGHTRKGQGPLPTSPTATHTYEHASLHTATLYVVDALGHLGQASAVITLSNPPPPVIPTPVTPTATTTTTTTPTFVSPAAVTTTTQPTFFIGNPSPPPSGPFIGGSSNPNPFFPSPPGPQNPSPFSPTNNNPSPFPPVTAPPMSPAPTFGTPPTFPPQPPTNNVTPPANTPPLPDVSPPAAPTPPSPTPTPPARTSVAPSAPSSSGAPSFTPPPSPFAPPAGPLPAEITASPVVARTLLLSLDRNSVEPGSEVTAVGDGCDAKAPVMLELGGRSVGTTTADDTGHFKAPLDLNGTAIGDYDVLAHCGPTLQTRLGVTMTEKLDQPASAALLILLFVLLAGTVVVRATLGFG